MQLTKLQDELGIKNKYSTTYFNIIYNAINNKKDSTKFEYHHILPASIFPKYKNLKDNLWNGVYLTFKEHYICHLLLWKYFKSINKPNKDMTASLWCMSNNRRYNANQYSILKYNINESRKINIDINWLQNELKTKTILKIADESEYSYKLLYDRIKEYNLQIFVSGRNNVRIDINIDWLQKQLVGKTVLQISTEFNLSKPTLRKRIKDNNLIIYKTRNNNIDKLYIINSYLNGILFKEISADCGCSLQSVYNCINEYKQNLTYL